MEQNISLRHSTQVFVFSFTTNADIVSTKTLNRQWPRLLSKTDPCQFLLTIRAIEPRKRMPHLPGGFLNYGEHPESGIRRELMEELGIKAEKLTLFNSEVVDYPYRQDLHSVVTLFYLTQPIETAPFVTEAKIASCAFHTLHELPKQKKRFAFASDLLCLEKYSKYLEEKSVF